jgi:hypothetical protein
MTINRSLLKAMQEMLVKRLTCYVSIAGTTANANPANPKLQVREIAA